jgi:hypothetical protein
MDDPERRRRVRARNYALGGVLLFLVLLFFVITLVKLGSN